MIVLLLIHAQCQAIVFVGFANETHIQHNQNLNISNANIQNFEDYEYLAMNIKFKESLLSYVVREINDQQFQFYDIWCLLNSRDYYKIVKITPYLNYNVEQIYEFTQKGIFCLKIYLFEERFTLDCSNYIDKQINLIQYNLVSNTVSSLNITPSFDMNLYRKVYFQTNRLIFLIQYRDDNIISVYDLILKQETWKWNKFHFNLTTLNVQKIIIQGYMILILTQTQQLYKFQMVSDSIPIQICENLQIQDIQEMVGVQIIIFTKFHRFKLTEYQNCNEQQNLKNQPILYSVFNVNETEMEIKTLIYNFIYQTSSELKSCFPFSYGMFFYMQQMLLCRNNHYLQQILLPIIQFQQILISNNFYQSSNQLIIIRVLEQGEIMYIEQDQDFFPIISVESERTEVVHNILFYGPNITYSFKADNMQVKFQNEILVSSYDHENCIYYELLQFYLQETLFSFLCQYQNKTVVIKQNYRKQNQQLSQYNFQFIYELDVYLGYNYKILLSNCFHLSIQNINTKQIYKYDQIVEQQKQQIFHYKNQQNYNCSLLANHVYCEKGAYNYTFYLNYIQSLNISQEVRFAYMPLDTFFLFLVTQNYVIVIHIHMIDDEVQKFQLIQIFQTNNNIKQLFYSKSVLYVVSSNQGYLSIQKYFEISQFYFKYLGQVDCLGYKIDDTESIQGSNGADDYYFINSFNNVIVFQLSKSLQDSLQYVISDSIFLKSKNYQFCVIKKNQVLCFSMAFGFTIFNIDLDQFKYSQIVPYEVCAQNTKTKKCIKQNLKLLIRQQKLIINGYQLTQINSNDHKIDFDIKQGYIRDLSIIDGHAQLLQNLHLIFVQNRTITQQQDLKDIILLNCVGQLIYYDKRVQKLQKIPNIKCQKLFWIKNYLLCFDQLKLIRYYQCDDSWNCETKNETLIDGQIMDLKSSGQFIIYKSTTQFKIMQFSSKSLNFNNIFNDERLSQLDLIQSIKDNDCWLVRLKWQHLHLYKFANLQLLSSFKIDYFVRFNLDNQFTDKNDEVISILTLTYDENSISLLFLMRQSPHKAYKISLIKDQVDMSCLFILLNNKFDLQQQQIQFSLNDDLLSIMSNNYNIGFYNISLDLNSFYRNIIFYFDVQKILKDPLIKKMHHFYYNDQLYMLFQTIVQIQLYQVDLSYKIRMLNNHQLTKVNLNRMKENLLIQLEIPNSVQFNSNFFYISLMIILLLGYVYRRYKSLISNK